MSPFPRTAEGRPLLPGRVSHILTWDMGWASSVPSDLTITGSTTTIVGSGGAGALNLVLTGSQAQITLPTVDVTSPHVRAASLTVHGLRCDAAGYPGTQFLDLSSGGTGGVSWSRALTLNSRSGTDTAVLAPVVTTTAGKKFSSTFSLVLLPLTKQAAIIQADQVMTAGTFPNMVLSAALAPRLTFGGSVGNTVAISKITLEVRTD